MAAAARQRELVRYQGDASKVQPPKWYPFQLAYILMNLRGIFDPTHLDRETVDLLFFPTGGGKTEAYLGLAAFAMVLRRLRHPGIRSAGVCVLMRYTLRLLTLGPVEPRRCRYLRARIGARERQGQAWRMAVRNRSVGRLRRHTQPHGPARRHQLRGEVHRLHQDDALPEEFQQQSRAHPDRKLSLVRPQV